MARQDRGVTDRWVFSFSIFSKKTAFFVHAFSVFLAGKAGYNRLALSESGLRRENLKGEIQDSVVLKVENGEGARGELLSPPPREPFNSLVSSCF